MQEDVSYNVVYTGDTSQTLDTKIAAEVRLSHIDMFDLHVDVVHLAVGLLCTSELASRAKIRRGIIRKKLSSVSVKQCYRRKRLAH